MTPERAGTDIAAEIRNRIAANGPMNFADYMEIALYAPGGYFDRLPVGAGGDFLTSPHVHPVFGELLARAILDLWSTTGGDPERPPTVVEIGAADGTLLAQLRDHLRDANLIGVERSASGRAATERRGIAAFAAIQDAPVHPGQPVVVIANEVLDNLPFHRLVRRGTQVAEVKVALDSSGGLVEVEGLAPEHLIALCEPSGTGEEVRVSPATARFLDGLAPYLCGGAGLFIDYAATTGTGSTQATHGYRRHRQTTNVLLDPGSADITAGIDLVAIARRARELDLDVHGPVSQREVLAELGFQDWEERQLQRQSAALEDRSGRDAIRVWSDRRSARTLVERGGLGDHAWFILTREGSRAPRWLTPP